MGCVANQTAEKIHPLMDFSSEQASAFFEPLIKKLQIKYKYYRDETLTQEESGSYDLNLLQSQIRNIYMGVIQKKLELTNAGKLTLKQCKIQISKLMMEVQILILKHVQKNLPAQTQMFFDGMNKFLIKLIKFLKTMYPRGQNIQAGELAKHFIQFDASEQYEYDVLRNSNICFTSTDKFEITRTIKLFLNKILDELSKSYQTFHQTIYGIDPSFKIGRKISQNTAKYIRLDTGIIQLNSTQIARVLIKWMEFLSQNISNPDLNISVKSDYKYYRKSKDTDQIQFTKCQKTDFQKHMRNGLLQKLNHVKTEIKQKSSKRNQQFQSFSTNIIKVLNEVNHNQHQVSNQFMEIIKYSYYNNDFISWMVEQELIQLIQRLVDVSHEFKLDLIKFKISDIMRCQVLGTQKQLLEIYAKFKGLQTTGKLQIIRIKNRFATPMSDAMIFFMIKDSFILCQCQLILAQQYTENAKKAKNIQTINHFLYELERSPFGVLGQISVFLRAKSQSVSAYCNKINLSLVNTDKIKFCQENHKDDKDQDQEMQQTPFVCNKCIKYFPKYSNHMKIFRCSICDLKMCNNCVKWSFSITNKHLFGQITQKINDLKAQFKDSKYCKNMQQDDVQEKYFKKLTAESVINNIFLTTNNDDQQFVDQQFEAQKFVISKKFANIRDDGLKVQTIIEYIKKNQDYKKYYIDKDLKVHFVIVSWKGQNCSLKCYQYNHSKDTIQNVYQSLQKYDKAQSIEVNKFDLFLQFQDGMVCRFDQVLPPSKNAPPIKGNIQIEPRAKKQLQMGLFIFEGQQKSKMMIQFESIPKKERDKYSLVFLKLSKPWNLIICFDYSLKRMKQKGKILDYFKNLNDMSKFRKNILLNSMNINNEELKTIKEIKQMKNIKSIDLSQNSINNIDIVLTQCTQLQKVNVSHNTIETLIFKSYLLSIKQFNAEYNNITKVVNLKNLPKVQMLNLRSNQIVSIIVGDKSENLSFPELKKLTLSNNQLFDLYEFQQVDFSKLTTLYLDSNKLKKMIELRMPKIQSIDMSCNQIQNIDEFCKCQYVNLTEINLHSNKLNLFSKFNFKKLQKIDISYNFTKQITNISEGQYFQNLTHLMLSQIKPEKLPKLPRSIKTFGYQNCQLSDKQLNDFINNYKHPKIVCLYLTKNKITKLPNIQKFSKLKELFLDQNPILDLNAIQIKTKYEEISEDQDQDKNKQKQKQNDNLKSGSKVKMNQTSRKGLSATIQQGESKSLLECYKNLTRLWVSLSIKSDKTFSQTKQNIIKTLPNTKMVVWKYYSNSIKNNQDKGILPKRFYLNQIFQTEEKINDRYQPIRNTNLYSLKHQWSTIDIRQFIKYDWRCLEDIDLRGAGIYTNQWELLVNNASCFPNIKRIDIWDNKISIVAAGSLEKFTKLKRINFGQQDGWSNPLSKESREYLLKFKVEHNQIEVQFR